MLESLVSRWTSPPSGRRSREVQSDPECEDGNTGADAATQSRRGRGRAARLLQDKRRRSRRSFADISAPVPVPSGHDLRPSKSLGRLDGMKEVERLAQYDRLLGGGTACDTDLDRIQELFPNDYLALYDSDAPSAQLQNSVKIKTLLRKRPSLDLGLLGSSNNGSCQRSPSAHNLSNNNNNNNNKTSSANGDGGIRKERRFLMEAPCTFSACPSVGGSPDLPGGVSGGGDPTASAPTGSTQDRHLFLFTDLLLVAKPRGGCFKLKECVRLSELWVSAAARPTCCLLGWARGSQVTTVRCAWGTQAARDTWLRGLQAALIATLADEPPETNIQLLYKDPNGMDYTKTLTVGPSVTADVVVRQAISLFGLPARCRPDLRLAVIETSSSNSGGSSSGNNSAAVLVGCERPHAIQMARIRQSLSSEEGFDLRHVNSRHNPCCNLVFELRGINKTVIKRTPLKLFRRSSGRLFGVALTTLCAPLQGQAPAPVICMLRALLLRGPLTQGIFRKSANARALRELRDKMDSIGPSGDANALIESAPVILVASLLKDFLRSLPNPLLCSALYDNWVRVLTLPSVKEQLASIRSLLLQLPSCHLTLLAQVLSVLHTVARRSSVNLMCASNLGVCVGPSVLWPPGPPMQLHEPRAVPQLLQLLITHAEELFHTIRAAGSETIVADSGAEESDSLHSVGLSLDSLELGCVRKEKLSLSRDSGLTLSEDDSISTGGQSPAPHAIFCRAPQQQQAQQVKVRTFVPQQYVRTKSSGDLLENTNGPSYSRVYGGWEQRISHYTQQQANSAVESTFKRRDWSRQASRTKSNEGASTDSSQDSAGESKCRDQCQQRTLDPSHVCCRSPYFRTEKSKMYYAHYNNQDNKDYYGRQKSHIKQSKSTSAVTNLYSNLNNNTDGFCDGIYGSNESYENSHYENVYVNRVNAFRAPPVPPRRFAHLTAGPQKHSVSLTISEERNSRSRSRSTSVGPVFRPLPSMHVANVISLQDTDTESESYV